MSKIVVSRKNPVLPVVAPPKKEKPLYWEDVISEQYPNIAIMAKKKSGKSTVVFHMLNKLIDPESQIIIFCPSYFKDETYIHGIEALEERGFNVICHATTEPLKDLMEEIDESLQPQSGGSMLELQAKMFGGKKEEEKKEPKYRTRPYIFVFDDLGTDLRNRDIEQLIIKNRHYRSTCIYSFHKSTHITPTMRNSMDYILLFARIPEDDLEKFFKDADIPATWEEFINAYQMATREKYSFLFVDMAGPADKRFRINFG